MRAPDAELLEIYGTVKEADATVLAARIAAAVLGLGLMEADREHVEEQREEAAMLNDLARYQEAKKMRAMVSAMEMAKSAGVTMASMHKEAFGAFVGKGLQNVAKANKSGPSLGSAAVGVVKKVAPTVAVLGAGLAGYKGLSALRDYANTPKSSGTWGTKRSLRHNVNEYGQPAL
jgi:hypothetical protein